MEEFIQTLQELGINFRSGRVDDETLRVTIMDDSKADLVDFEFEDTVDANFKKVRTI